MVSAIKIRAKDDEIEVELSISVEGTPLIEDIKDFKKSIIEDVKKLRNSKIENTLDEPIEVEEAESEESGKINPKIEVKPVTSELNVKIEEQVRKSNMYG